MSICTLLTSYRRYCRPLQVGIKPMNCTTQNLHQVTSTYLSQVNRTFGWKTFWTWDSRHDTNFYEVRIKKLIYRLTKCIDVHGDYVKKSEVYSIDFINQSQNKLLQKIFLKFVSLLSKYIKKYYHSFCVRYSTYWFGILFSVVHFWWVYVMTLRKHAW